MLQPTEPPGQGHVKYFWIWKILGKNTSACFFSQSFASVFMFIDGYTESPKFDAVFIFPNDLKDS